MEATLNWRSTSVGLKNIIDIANLLAGGDGWQRLMSNDGGEVVYVCRYGVGDRWSMILIGRCWICNDNAYRHAVGPVQVGVMEMLTNRGRMLVMWAGVHVGK